MQVSGDWLTSSTTQQVLSCLLAAGWQALPVGGCVRNAVLGVPVTDVDIATDARPDIVSALAEKAGFRVVPTGIEHGTVTVIANGTPFEITTFRRDVKTDGRRAAVAYSDRVEEDAARRDFTMNALYCRADGMVVDPLGGLQDLLARRVRFVGNAETRIREDYLRILRFFRFHALYGDPDAGLDADGLAACAANSAGIETLSAERLGAEMKKLLSAPDPAPAVAAMAQAGVLAAVLPGADPQALAPLVHLEEGGAPRWQRRLAVLCANGVSNRLRLSRAEAKDVEGIAKAARGGAGLAETGWKLGATAGTDAALARAALLGMPLPANWRKEIARGAVATFPIRAKDLPGLEGPVLGARLRDLQRKWLDSGLHATKAQLLG